MWLTPQEFAKNWARAALSERASYQQHFPDLCAVLGVGRSTLYRLLSEDGDGKGDWE